MAKAILLLLALYINSIDGRGRNLSIIFEWEQLDFDYDSNDQRQSDIDDGTFNISHISPLGLDVTDKYIFISVPRYYQRGVPASFGIVTNNTRDGNPLIKPYPSWDWHTEPESCKEHRLVSVYRSQLDQCGRLWVIDSGKVYYNQTCPGQILAFDINTDELLHKYEIPSNITNSSSLFVTIIAEVENELNNCENTFLYVADGGAGALVVYDYKRRISWQIQHESFQADPNFARYSIDGVSYNQSVGVLGMAISPPLERHRKLFYQPMSSGSMSYVETRYLKNWLNSQNPDYFQTYANQRNTQSAALDIDVAGVAYFGLINDTSVDYWNTAVEYGMDNIYLIERNLTTLQFISGLRVFKNFLFVLSSRFQLAATQQVNGNETNFRILFGYIPHLLEDRHDEIILVRQKFPIWYLPH